MYLEEWKGLFYNLLYLFARLEGSEPENRFTYLLQVLFTLLIDMFAILGHRRSPVLNVNDHTIAAHRLEAVHTHLQCLYLTALRARCNDFDIFLAWCWATTLVLKRTKSNDAFKQQ